MTIAEVLALADRDSTDIPPLTQNQADLAAALIATARARQAAA